MYFGVRNDGEIFGQQIGDRTLREVFDISENFITVTIPLNHRRNAKGGLSDTAAKGIDSRDGRILELMKENPNIRVGEISRLIGLGTTTITKRIHCLKEMQLLKERVQKRQDNGL